jgi:ATP-dependent Lon protease
VRRRDVRLDRPSRHRRAGRQALRRRPRRVEKLERASDQSPEGSWIRTWLDTVLEPPWNERTDDTAGYDIRGAKAILDSEHAGLQDVKERITEYLAAHRAGITTVVIPKRNEADLDGVPAEILDPLEVHPVTDVRQVLEPALSPAELPVAAVA